MWYNFIASRHLSVSWSNIWQTFNYEQMVAPRKSYFILSLSFRQIFLLSFALPAVLSYVPLAQQLPSIFFTVLRLVATSIKSKFNVIVLFVRLLISLSDRSYYFQFEIAIYSFYLQAPSMVNQWAVSSLQAPVIANELNLPHSSSSYRAYISRSLSGRNVTRFKVLAVECLWKNMSQILSFLDEYSTFNQKYLILCVSVIHTSCWLSVIECSTIEESAPIIHIW